MHMTDLTHWHIWLSESTESHSRPYLGKHLRFFSYFLYPHKFFLIKKNKTKLKLLKKMSDKETSKRQKVENIPPVCTLYEFIDFEVLRDIYEMHLPSEYEYKVVVLYKAMLKNDSQRIPVEYYESETSPQGRLYASGPSLQNLKGWIKRALSWRTHFDLDFVLCGPSLWQQLLHLKVPQYDDKLHLLHVLINDR